MENLGWPQLRKYPLFKKSGYFVGHFGLQWKQYIELTEVVHKVTNVCKVGLLRPLIFSNRITVRKKTG